jgi:glycyl-tRNA synthetase beta chain
VDAAKEDAGSGMTVRDFLLEIRTEEIPGPVVETARRDLARRVAEGLSEIGLAAASTESYGTPRRMILVLRGLPEKLEDRHSEVLGPASSAAYDADGHPTKAARGFARAQEVPVADLVVVDSPRGPVIAARRTIPGRRTAELLAEVVPRAVEGMTFPKTMRWGSGARSFVRPVRGVVAVFGGQVVPMEVLGVASSGRTVGHPINSELGIRVSGPDDYFRKLRASHVEPDAVQRRLKILEGPASSRKKSAGRSTPTPTSPRCSRTWSSAPASSAAHSLPSSWSSPRKSRRRPCGRTRNICRFAVRPA